MRPPRRVLTALLSLTLAAACVSPESAPDPGSVPVAPPGSAAALGAEVAELTAVRGLADVRTDDLPEGTSFTPGARLRAGQRLLVPPGSLAELRLLDGRLVRVGEDTRLVVRDDAQLVLEAGEVVVLVAADQPPLVVRVGPDLLHVTRGEARAWTRDDRRRYDMVHGTARLDSEGRAIDLGPGAHLELPLAAAEPGRAPVPEVSLRPLADTAWSRTFEAVAARVDAVPAGVGSLTARRAGSDVTLHKLALTEQKVRVVISGRIARTEIEQTFHNEAAEVLEGTYRFPLPADASISGLSLLVGDTWMDAEMLEKQRARAIFKQIVDATIPRDPALLEWEHGNIFKMRIFPIPGRGARKIRLSYTEVLPAVGDTLRYRYPFAGSGSGAAGEPIGAFEFTLVVDRAELPPGAAIATPMHRLDRRELADTVELSTRATGFVPTGDFGVDLPLDPREQRQHAETFLDRDGQAYFMLALRPELALPRERRPTHYVFVLDRSHSMTPELWTVAHGLVQALAGALDDADRMTVLACDTACDAAPGGLAPAAAALPAAETFLAAQTLAGASDIGGMMRAASDVLAAHDPKDSTVERVIVYLGDGNATAGELAPDELLRHLERPLAGTRVQAVALGARSDLLLLGALTRDTGGDLLRADASDDLTDLVRELHLRALVPVARPVELALPPGLVHTHPQRLTALRAGEPVLLVGKLAGPVHGPLEIRATGPDGHVYSDSFQIDLEAAPAAADARHAHLPRTWARLEIDDLTARRGHAARADIVALSRQHHVLSRYTALIALENDAMYREFGVVRQAAGTTGWNGQLAPATTPSPDPAPAQSESAGAVPPAPASEPEPDARPTDSSAEARKDSAGDLGDLLDSLGPDNIATGTGVGSRGDDTGAGNLGAGSLGTGDSPGVGGIGSIGVGSGYGSGGGFGRLMRRTVATWKFGNPSAPSADDIFTLAELREAVRRDPTSRPAHRKLVQYAIKVGATDAFTDATAWAQADPDHAPALLAVADLLAARGDPAAARAYASAAEVDRFRPVVHTRLAEAFASKGDLARSCAHRRALVSIDPARPEHHLQLVRCLDDLGRRDLARDAAADGIARARSSSRELQAALAAPLPAPKPRSVAGDVVGALTWTGDADLDLAFVDARGRRLSGLRGEGVRVVEGAGRETAALPLSAGQTLTVEVTRFAGQGPVDAELKLRAGGQVRTIPFTIDQGTLRLSTIGYTVQTRDANPKVQFTDKELRIQGNLDRDIVRRVLRARGNQLRYCYERALQQFPDAAGRITVQFAIGEAGNVLTTALREDTLNVAEVGQCVMATIRRMQFPRPEGGAVIVTYPMVFQQ